MDLTFNLQLFQFLPHHKHLLIQQCTIKIMEGSVSVLNFTIRVEDRYCIGSLTGNVFRWYEGWLDRGLGETEGMRPARK